MEKRSDKTKPQTLRESGEMPGMYRTRGQAAGQGQASCVHFISRLGFGV